MQLLLLPPSIQSSPGSVLIPQKISHLPSPRPLRKVQSRDSVCGFNIDIRTANFDQELQHAKVIEIDRHVQSW